MVDKRTIADDSIAQLLDGHRQLWFSYISYYHAEPHQLRKSGAGTKT